jgi:solute carrier family 25 carnitine/acylcarnitine transporter 20/29
MTHNHKRAEWYKEGLYSLICGLLFGATNAIVGHPFDTIKTKMQAQHDFIGKMGYLDSIKMVYNKYGPIGFYRGFIPPIIGSTIYRSIQFSAFEAVFTKCESHPSTRHKIPFSGGIELRILLGAFTSATCRAIIECPFEFVKVRRQTGQEWKLADGYTGFQVLYMRTLGLMTSYFIIIDSFRRHTTIFNHKVGQFLAGGTAAMIAFWVVWPIEVLKN